MRKQRYYILTFAVFAFAILTVLSSCATFGSTKTVNGVKIPKDAAAYEIDSDGVMTINL